MGEYLHANLEAMLRQAEHDRDVWRTLYEQYRPIKVQLPGPAVEAIIREQQRQIEAERAAQAAQTAELVNDLNRARNLLLGIYKYGMTSEITDEVKNHLFGVKP